PFVLDERGADHVHVDPGEQAGDPVAVRLEVRDRAHELWDPQEPDRAPRAREHALVDQTLVRARDLQDRRAAGDVVAGALLRHALEEVRDEGDLLIGRTVARDRGDRDLVRDVREDLRFHHRPDPDGAALDEIDDFLPEPVREREGEDAGPLGRLRDARPRDQVRPVDRLAQRVVRAHDPDRAPLDDRRLHDRSDRARREHDLAPNVLPRIIARAGAATDEDQLRGHIRRRRTGDERSRHVTVRDQEAPLRRLQPQLAAPRVPLRVRLETYDVHVRQAVLLRHPHHVLRLEVRVAVLALVALPLVRTHLVDMAHRHRARDFVRDPIQDRLRQERDRVRLLLRARGRRYHAQRRDEDEYLPQYVSHRLPSCPGPVAGRTWMRPVRRALAPDPVYGVYGIVGHGIRFGNTRRRFLTRRPTPRGRR